MFAVVPGMHELPIGNSVLFLCDLFYATERKSHLFHKVNLISKNINRSKITFSTYIHAATTDILHGFTLIALSLENTDNRKPPLIPAPHKFSSKNQTKTRHYKQDTSMGQ